MYDMEVAGIMEGLQTMSDRLEEIKITAKSLFQHGYRYFAAQEDIDWLISEVERLTKRCEEARKFLEEHSHSWDAAAASCAALREGLLRRRAAHRRM